MRVCIKKTHELECLFVCQKHTRVEKSSHCAKPSKQECRCCLSLFPHLLSLFLALSPFAFSPSCFILNLSHCLFPLRSGNKHIFFSNVNHTQNHVQVMMKVVLQEVRSRIWPALLLKTFSASQIHTCLFSGNQTNLT